MWQLIKDKLENHMLQISLIGVAITLFFFIAAGVIFLRREDSPVEEATEEQTELFLTNPEQETGEKEHSSIESAESIPQVLYVDVKGAVQKPGVYQMAPGARMMDAIDLAGGFLISADQSQINLALKLDDQMVVYVPQVGEETKETAQQTIVEETETEEKAKINLNTADAAQLQSLNGIGEKKAEAIIQYREENGSFQTIEDLKNVSGIGDKTFEALKDFIATGSE